ncbi:DUF2971 domain-containing protein [Hypericibacter sp.]|uniref:DUF2971 domain-containing protein n=1 Tax=Hypericibacter sp. TaxID=2705401 RepID=UPI003D6D506E
MSQDPYFAGRSAWVNDREYFFKYASRGTARAVLENQTLRWSTPATLNDPYDVQFDLHIEVDRDAVKAAALQRLWDAHYGDQPVRVGNKLGEAIRVVRGFFPRLSREEFNDTYGESMDEGFNAAERSLPEVQAQIRAEMAKSKLLCLAELPDDLAMWAYYAEQHCGVVFRIRSVPELDSPWGMARPVQYVLEMPRLVDEPFLVEMLSGAASFDVPSINDRLVYTKSIHWAHEREWRVVAGSGRNPQAPYEDIKFHAAELDAVILGARMAREDRAVFIDLLRNRFPTTTILQASTAGKRFQLEFKVVGD